MSGVSDGELGSVHSADLFEHKWLEMSVYKCA
jgi:hypothetical protein